MKVKCPKCEGEGWVIHPLWKEYWREHRKYEERECEEWFEKVGLTSLPPEEILCPLCKGDGELDVVIVMSIQGVRVIPLI